MLQKDPLAAHYTWEYGIWSSLSLSLSLSLSRSSEFGDA